MVHAPVALFEAHRVAMRITILIEPGSFIKIERVNDECVSLPLTGGVAVPPREVVQVLGIFRKYSSIRPDFAQYSMPLEKLQQPALRLNELKWSGKKQDSWQTLRITVPNDVISRCGRNRPGSVSGLTGIELRLTLGRHRRNVAPWAGTHATVSRRPIPNSRQVMWVKWEGCGWSVVPRRSPSLTPLSDEGGRENQYQGNNQTHEANSHF